MQVEVIVVDNDPAGSARSVVQRSQLFPEVCYVHEKRQGIAQARNAAIEATSADWIAFVDDDETVHSQWLVNLMNTALRYQAQIVGGPVVPQFASGVAHWFSAGGFLVRPRYTTGSVPRHIVTASVLIRRSVLDRIGVFAERYGLTGGEDVEFFGRAETAGFRIVWSDEAIAYEYVGAERGNLRYLLRRQFQSAAIATRIEIEKHPYIRTYLQRFCKGVLRAVQGAVVLPIALIGGQVEAARAVQRIFLGAGSIRGLVKYDSAHY
jgi:succinoglycan biosynthesis protein ExoM